MSKLAFGVCVVAFFGYTFMMLIAPILCGWHGDGDLMMCKVLPAPLRLLVFSEFVFVIIVGVSLLVAGVIVIVKG